MSDLIDKALSVVTALAAVGILVVMFHREFGRSSAVQRVAGQSGYYGQWKDLIPAGHLIGNPAARVTVVEFTDLECPFCRRFDEVLRRTREEYPNDLNYVFVHFPLSMHRFAKSAARAAECATPFGKFDEAVRTIFAKQDSLGLKTWASFASDLQLRDTAAFQRCASTSWPVERVEAGLAAGAKMGIHATPTILLNGWRYGSVPADSELARAVGDILAGRKPYPNYGATRQQSP